MCVTRMFLRAIEAKRMLILRIRKISRTDNDERANSRLMWHIELRGAVKSEGNRLNELV